MTDRSSASRQLLADPDGCRWCGTGKRLHCQRWDPVVGRHGWIPPTEVQRLDRMRARRVTRLLAS